MMPADESIELITFADYWGVRPLANILEDVDNSGIEFDLYWDYLLPKREVEWSVINGEAVL